MYLIRTNCNFLIKMRCTALTAALLVLLLVAPQVMTLSTPDSSRILAKTRIQYLQNDLAKVT
jgi:hypothetical protein